MGSHSKTENLEKLRDEILASIPDAWLFPERGRVKGFLGPGPVMLVAERPSTGHFGGPSDYLLYTLLEKYDAADAHLTDVIKCRGRVGDSYPNDIGPHRLIFDRELEIVQPTLIVAFGQKVYDLLQFSLAGLGIPIRTVWHYAYARRGEAKANAFEQQMKNALLGLPSYAVPAINS